jgi:hypothetical protein
LPRSSRCVTQRELLPKKNIAMEKRNGVTRRRHGTAGDDATRTGGNARASFERWTFARVLGGVGGLWRQARGRRMSRVALGAEVGTGCVALTKPNQNILSIISHLSRPLSSLCLIQVRAPVRAVFAVRAEAVSDAPERATYEARASSAALSRPCTAALYRG